jgi:hypothetical protein
MDKKIIIRNAALMVIFAVTGLLQFTENVRTVQIVGLLASGVGFGAALTVIIQSYRSEKKKV